MIKIITDSTAYMPSDYIKNNNITVIPLRVLFNEEEFEEGAPGSYDDFFEKFTKTKVFPKTSQPSLETFIDEYNKIIDAGDEAIVFTISFTLSGTYSAANLAKEQCKNPEKITVIDSKSCCQNVWGYVMETLDMIKEGFSREQIVKEIEKLQVNSQISFVPDSLEYLKRGGRIGKVSATIGTLLQLKPLLAFKEGVLGCAKKVIGISKAIQELIGMIPKNIKRLFIIHIANSKFFDMLKTQMEGKFEDVPTYEGEIGPVVAAHIGPAIGVSWIC